MSGKKVILYFHQDALITGSLISLRNTLLALDKSTFHPIVVLPSHGDAEELLGSIGIDLKIFPFRTFWTSPGPRCLSRQNVKQWLSFLPNSKLRAFIKSINPDIIHLNDKALINVGISCKPLGIPIVQHSRSAYHFTACPMNRKASAMLIKYYADTIISISEDEEQEFEHRKNKTIIFNSVPVESSEEAIRNRTIMRRELGLSDDDFAIGMAENLGVYKGFFDVIKLAESLLLKNPVKNIKFIIAGKISQTDSLLKFGIQQSSFDYIQQFITDNNLADQIKLLGFRKDVLNVIAATDVMVISKAHGVLGRQPLEAQSVGVPVVAINGHSKRSTVVKHGVTGYLADNLSELEGFIRQLSADKAPLKKMSEAGLAYARANFNPGINTRKLEHIYHRLIEAH